MVGDISWTKIFKISWQGFSKNHLPGIILWLSAILFGPAAGVLMNNKKSIIIGAAIGLTVLVWACAFFLIKSTQTEEEPKKLKEITLLYLFENDFSNLMRYGQDATFVGNDGVEINFQMKEYFDFEAQSKFIGFYIPSSKRTFEFLELLPEKYQALSSKDKVMVEMSVPGIQPVNISELKFSGRVFIYHESLILEAQKRSLYALYEKYGLSPQFRGVDYLVNKKSAEEKTH